MSKWIALIKVGGYNVGDSVPEDKALHWNKVFAVPHARLVSDDDEEKELDLNKDGKVDDEDFSLAGKALAEKSKRGRKSKK